MEDENRNVNILEDLLLRLRSISSHEKIEYLARRKRGEVVSIPRGTGGTPLLIPESSYEDALQILHEMESVALGLESQINHAEKSSAIKPKGPRKLDLGEIFLERKEITIVRGSLRLVQWRPIISNVSESTALFIQNVDKRHKIIREIHGSWGYHFHYCDANEKRSDTVLSFRENLSNDGKEVVFYEAHAVGKSDFLARVDRWGRKKKESAYNACLEGLGKLALADFKKPGATAETLWPVS